VKEGVLVGVLEEMVSVTVREEVKVRVGVGVEVMEEVEEKV